MPQLRFEGRLESEQGACFVPLPAEVLAALGRGERVPVKVTVNGYTYRTTVAVYAGKYYLGVRRQIRDAAGVAAGEQLTVGLEYDAELRIADFHRRCARCSTPTRRPPPSSRNCPTRARRSSSNG